MKKIIWILTILALMISILVTLYDGFVITEIPALVSFIGWALFGIKNLSERISAEFQIRVKGFFTNTQIRIYTRVVTNVKFDDFRSRFKKSLVNEGYIVEKFSIDYGDKSEISIRRNNTKSVLSFTIKKFIDYQEIDEAIIIEFPQMLNRHSAILAYCSDIIYYIRLVERCVGDHELKSYTDISIVYPQRNNPVITELANKSNINLKAYGKTFSMTNDLIEIKTNALDFEKTIRDVLTGNVEDK